MFIKKDKSNVVQIGRLKIKGFVHCCRNPNIAVEDNLGFYKSKLTICDLFHFTEYF